MSTRGIRINENAWVLRMQAEAGISSTGQTGFTWKKGCAYSREAKTVQTSVNAMVYIFTVKQLSLQSGK